MEINMAKKQQLQYEVYYDDNVNGDFSLRSAKIYYYFT